MILRIKNFLCLIFCVIVVGNFSSCAFWKLGKEVAILDQTALLQGTVTGGAARGKPVIILLYQILDKDKKLVAYSIQYTPGNFSFNRLPGRYLIAAFEDANEDFIYQPSEKAAYFDNGTIISVISGEDISNLDLTLKNPDEVTLDEAPDLASQATKAELDFPKVQAGEIVTLNDQRFSPDNGQLGLWEPIQFLIAVGGGVYFLQPFDSQKIPVVFVHGAGGYPGQWNALIPRLDRARYQPWVFYYPSGLRLNMSAEFLVQALSRIWVKHKFEKFVIIAHSVGGLISRSLVNTIVEKDVKKRLRVLFFTISTPWGGHQAAPIGVGHAPAVIPFWKDMIPNSPFQQALFQTPLSDHIDYYLFFSFKGGRHPFGHKNDDGTVSLVSQLKAEAQDAAIKTIGFNEDHDSILRSQQATEKIMALLTTFANRE